jgi:O-6-methylguanine DNA methyltransferase
MVSPAQPVFAGAIETPLGTLHALLTPRGLCWLAFGDDRRERDRWIHRNLPRAPVVADKSRLEMLATQLAAYFGGSLRRFTIPLDLRGTPFQIVAWQALREIPYGGTRSYARHAAAIGRPRAIRAVGAANGANPIAIIVPCHRLVGSDGALVKYGGGLRLKQQLLALEGVDLTEHGMVARPRVGS